MLVLFFSLKYHIEKDKDDIAKMEKMLHDKFVISEISWNTFSPLARKPRKIGVEFIRTLSLQTTQNRDGIHSYPKLAKHAKLGMKFVRTLNLQSTQNRGWNSFVP